ncbi:MAG: hypothetical protein EHM64_03685 [Ignavibacteriae bacterium]|nr:MAG: hypothetical protein EHM64_03685 [Ignavibacteriota bacterium]
MKISPYLLISIILNVLAFRYFRDRKIQFSSKNEYLAIVSAALIGLASPLPTYAAIPIGLSLKNSGIPFSAVMAFILSSPLMNPTIFFLTATQISLEMAVARTISAFLLAITGGLLAIRFSGVLAPVITKALVERKPHDRSLWMDIYGNTKYIVKYFSIAILLSAAVKALIPPETIAALLGGNAKVSTLVAIGMGVPFYTCGGSAIPFMETLMEMGLQKGPMLAFFLAGPATKLETLYAYKSGFGTRILLFYLVLTLLFSYAAGLIYSFL